MIEQKLIELGKQLPQPVTPLASYVPALRTGDFVFTSGQVPMVNGAMLFSGITGANVSLEQAKACAELCVLNCLAAVKSVTGSLEKIEQIVKLSVFVASTSEFTDQPLVANGASDLLIQLFGEKGKHTRCAVGVSSLPKNAPVEIEMIVKLNG